MDSSPSVGEIAIIVVNDEKLFRNLVGIIMRGNPSETELLSRFQARAEEMFGRTFSDEEARQILPSFLAFVRRLNVADDGIDEADGRGLRDRIRFMVGGITFALRMRAIDACPQVFNLVTGKYTPVVDGENLSIVEVLNNVVGMEGLASEVVHRIEFIRNQRNEDPTFLLSDEEMEFLRQVLFLITKLKVGDHMFCNFGQGILGDLRTYVGDYERSRSQ